MNGYIWLTPVSLLVHFFLMLSYRDSDSNSLTCFPESMCCSTSSSVLKLRTHPVSVHGKISVRGRVFSAIVPRSFVLAPKGWITFNPVSPCLSIITLSYGKKQPGPTLKAFQAQTPLSSYKELFRKLIPGILFSTPTDLVVSTCTDSCSTAFEATVGFWSLFHIFCSYHTPISWYELSWGQFSCRKYLFRLGGRKSRSA